MSHKVRIDKLLVDGGMVSSRDRARALIMAGAVLVDETPVTKAGAQVSPDAVVRIKGDDNPFVSRGGLKLNGALDDLGFSVEGKTVLDVGASTGGFTDCCLQRGALHVYAVDVGTNQLAYRLRTDPRVVCMEHTNARNITVDMFPRRADLAVMDVSFISIRKLLEAVAACVTDTGHVLAMIKPQFEVGREKVGKGGVVRDEEYRTQAVDDVLAFASTLGLHLIGRAESRVPGPKGNREVFVLLENARRD